MKTAKRGTAAMKKSTLLAARVNDATAEMFNNLCSKNQLSPSDMFRHLIRNYVPLWEAFEYNKKIQKQYEKLLSTLDKMQQQNTKPEFFVDEIEDVLSRMGEQFGRTRHQVIAAILIDNIARQMAQLAVYAGDPVVFPEFTSDENGILENKKLFDILFKHYKIVLGNFKTECEKQGIGDLLKESGINEKMPVLNTN